MRKVQIAILLLFAITLTSFTLNVSILGNNCNSPESISVIKKYSSKVNLLFFINQQNFQESLETYNQIFQMEKNKNISVFVVNNSINLTAKFERGRIKKESIKVKYLEEYTCVKGKDIYIFDSLHFIKGQFKLNQGWGAIHNCIGYYSK